MAETDTEHSDFVQKLIDAVRERRCLYDKKHIAYFNRKEREKAWRQIGQELGRSDVDCHKRWKLLREKLAKELKKRDRALENGEAFQSDWACFESIMFVEDHISPRKKLDKQPLMLVKDLSKKRSLDDSDSKSYGPTEKRAYNANDFNFFMQLSKATATAANATPINENPSCSIVKSEPIDRDVSDDLDSLSAKENPIGDTIKNVSTSSSSSSSTFINQEVPGTLDLTKAVDVLLKDLKEKKETSFDFMKNLTNALKIKDLDIFKYGNPVNSNNVQNQQQQQPQHLKLNFNLNENTKSDENSDFDDETESFKCSKNLPNKEDSCDERLPVLYHHHRVNNLDNGFIKQASLSPVAKIELKADNATKIQGPSSFEASNGRVAEKDELFGKLVTSMLADITDDEFKDDAKFSIMQLLVNAKRACRAKRSD